MTLNILFGLATEIMNDIFGGLIQRVCQESSHTGGGPVDCQVLGVAGRGWLSLHQSHAS